MSAEPDPLLFDAIARELLGARGIEITFRPETALTLAGLVQLALRHPGVAAHTREVGERFLAGVREEFAGCPAVLELLHRGDDPAEDR